MTTPSATSHRINVQTWTILDLEMRNLHCSSRRKGNYLSEMPRKKKPEFADSATNCGSQYPLS